MKSHVEKYIPERGLSCFIVKNKPKYEIFSQIIQNNNNLIKLYFNFM